ncbi:hypothetical protein EI42_02276 [Thermosporothrix hazakensis]|uniref:Pectate lyase-like protein n=1 Tax=Thermosporothrix hazakensis TaxID=644383 RepID=A0A326U7M4_THEHA|nr:hypothetical protein [Thermosporothrix hazakensis]PZW31179.1 hypothetical protein EI42_02276 [Thermosporothrix hazakensis]GCE50910.1 hypothetical protein KTH_57790 [Thermosporothrix hazakensis]
MIVSSNGFANGFEGDRDSSLVSLKNGKLQYRMYANEGESEAIHTIPDFSYCGYRGGGVRLPQLPVRQVLTPVPGDNRARIQQAIDAVSSLPADNDGFRGAVLLKAGTYTVDGPLFLRTGGVVLRGEGQGPTGTVLIDTLREQHDFIQVGVLKKKKPWKPLKETRQPITSPVVPTGARRFAVTSTEGLKRGDRIIVQRTPDEAWITALDMAQYGWKADIYKVGYERVITDIAENTLLIDAPLVQAIVHRYGGGMIFKYTVERISEVGVEHLRLESVYGSETDEEHGWQAISMNCVENGWVSGVTARHFGFAAVGLNTSVQQVTVQDCAYLEGKSKIRGGRRYSFFIDSTSSRNLFQRCYASSGRHDFVTGSKVPGPNAFVDSFAEQAHNDTGPHHRYATGILFDNVSAPLMRVWNRKAMGSGHGWAGAQVLFWNCHAEQEMCVDSPPGARNWAIGCTVGKRSGAGYWERMGQKVSPRSLYYQQLQERLGAAALDNVMLPQQKRGSIWELLQVWAGNGLLS